ncbi:GTP-binding protein REM 2 [Amia ocellicauda]|uniref:GTP-binding protein REM 2 n=1 Tax=Amia ocellicauda TaxID=2972642 RepID=UPI003464B39D
MTLSSAPPLRRGSTPLPIKHQLRREEAVSEDSDWTLDVAGPSPPPISVSPALEDTITPPASEAKVGEREQEKEKQEGAAGEDCQPTLDRNTDGPVRIALLGQNGVGKSSLTTALCGGNDRTASVDSDNIAEDGMVSTVMMDEEEVTVIIYDNWRQDLSLLRVDVCVLVFSVTDRRSFHRTAQLRLQLRESHPNTPIILAGNKSDLVRSREVSGHEAQSSAALFDCQYVELSASLDHRVTELLQGAVRCARGWTPRRPGAGGGAGGTAGGGVEGGTGPGLGGRRKSLTSRARRFLSSLLPRHHSASSGRFCRQKSRSCHDLSSV